MLRPVHVPLPGDDKVSAVILHAEREGSLTLTTLAVRRTGGAVDPIVLVHFEDGGRESLAAAEARDMARRLRGEAGDVVALRAGDWASSLEDAAEIAEQQASQVFLAVREIHGVGSPREFRGAR